VVGFCTAGDPNLIPALLDASQNYTAMTESEQKELIATGSQFPSVFDGPVQLKME
jgi:hypothetical protein